MNDVPGPGSYDTGKPIGVNSRKACFFRKPHFLSPVERDTINDQFYDVDFAARKIHENIGDGTFGGAKKGLFVKKLNNYPGPGAHVLNTGVVSTMLITGKKRSTHGHVMLPGVKRLKRNRTHSSGFNF
jgi:hypothetical protein